MDAQYKRHMMRQHERLQGKLAVDCVKTGDIRHSDAFALLRSVERESVAAIIADPPYGIAYHSNRHQGKNPHAPIAQDWNVNIGRFLSECASALSEGGAVYLFTRWDVFPAWAQAAQASLALKNMVVWDKGNHSSGDLTGNFGFQHEVIMFLVKGRHTLKGHRLSNIWRAAKIPHGKLRMPAEKPELLYENAILSSSEKGDLVVDPFCGSGTLAAVAAKTGRRFLCGDIDKRMVRMSRERVGLSVGDDLIEELTVDEPCPILKLTPPDPALWGVHPEDIADWKTA